MFSLKSMRKKLAIRTDVSNACVPPKHDHQQEQPVALVCKHTRHHIVPAHPRERYLRPCTGKVSPLRMVRQDERLVVVLVARRAAVCVVPFVQPIENIHKVYQSTSDTYRAPAFRNHAHRQEIIHGQQIDRHTQRMRAYAESPCKPSVNNRRSFDFLSCGRLCSRSLPGRLLQ